MAPKMIKWLRRILFRGNIGDEMHEVCTRHPDTNTQYEIEEAYDPFLKRNQFVIREKKKNAARSYQPGGVQLMKNIIYILTTLTLTGCLTNDPEIKAPSHMKSHAHHLYKSIPKCFKDNGISSKKYDCDLVIKTTPATSVHKGHPVFDYNGAKVGGVTSGNCGSKAKITIAQNGDEWSQSVLHHEMCHAYDICGPCRKGHPGEYETCCPHWPYLRSLEAVDGTELQEATCISTTIDGVDYLITVFDDEDPKIKTHDWWHGLIDYIGHNDD